MRESHVPMLSNIEGQSSGLTERSKGRLQYPLIGPRAQSRNTHSHAHPNDRHTERAGKETDRAGRSTGPPMQRHIWHLPELPDCQSSSFIKEPNIFVHVDALTGRVLYPFKPQKCSNCESRNTVCMENANYQILTH